MVKTEPRLTVPAAAELLAVGPVTVRRLIRKKVLTATTNSGEQGVAQRYYLDRGEVEAFATGGPAGAAAYRATKARPVHVRKGRRAATV